MNNLLEKDVTATIGTQKYLCKVTWRNGVFVMDEPVSAMGGDEGPDPYTTLLASLAGCTLSTLRMYIDRKGWDIPEIGVQLNMTQEKEPSITTFIKRELFIGSPITEEQREKLVAMARKCPVSRILENTVQIDTSL